LRRTLRLGSRGSALALRQIEIVEGLLKKNGVEVDLELVIIRTSGDEGKRELVGAFVGEVQDALLGNRIDVGIHSLKDMPTGDVPGLIIAAVPGREDSRDVILSRRGPFAALPPGSFVGTGSVRRQAQLAAVRPDLRYRDLVGNVDTRIRKLHEGQYDAIVLALAGIRRLGYVDSENGLLLEVLADGIGVGVGDLDGFFLDVLDGHTILPAPAQGALGLECRADDEWVLGILRKLDRGEVHRAVLAERTVLRELGGGCSTPVAAYGFYEGEALRLSALVSSPDGVRVVRAEGGSIGDPIALGELIADKLRRQGAGEILEALDVAGA